MNFAYTKWRPWIFSLAGGGLILLGVYLLYLELFTPPTLPRIPKTIISKAPVQSHPPNVNEKQTYSVPAHHPRRLIIRSLDIDALVKPIGLLPNGALDAPNTAWEVGWYTSSSLPGQPGAMVMDGHVNDSFNAPGVFAKLKNLQPGDSIEVERGDREHFHYRVVDVEQVTADKIDMARAIRPAAERKEGLNLITCGGTYNHAQQTYGDRVIVFASP